jgi:hypothetical protein
MPWKTCGEAHMAHYTNLHTDTRAPHGPATQAEASEADLGGNQPIATHEGSLKRTRNRNIPDSLCGVNPSARFYDV